MGVLNQNISPDGSQVFEGGGSQSFGNPQFGGGTSYGDHAGGGNFGMPPNKLVGGVPGVGGGSAGGGGMAPTNSFGTSGWTPGFNAQSGYNPSQYANLDTTNQLAQALGGNAMQTRMGPGDPFGVPPQNSISFGGDSPLNAGLLAERYQKYDRATADAMTRAELAMQGPQQSPNADSNGGSLGSWSQWQGLPGGAQALGGGANLGSSVSATQPQTPAAASAMAAPGNQITNTPGTPSGASGDTHNQIANNGISSPQMQLLQMLLGGGGQSAFGGGGGYSPLSPGIGQQPQYQQRPQRQGFGGTGGRGQFQNFMTGNGYQQQGNIWARPGSAQPTYPNSMQGYGNMMQQNQGGGQFNPYRQTQNGGYFQQSPQGYGGYGGQGGYGGTMSGFANMMNQFQGGSRQY